MPLHCQIITQERKLYDEEVDIVIAPGVEGEMAILPQHTPLLAALDFGELRVRRGDVEEAFAIGGGVIQVAHDRVIVLAESAEQAEEIDVARAEAARQRAQQMMASGAARDPASLAALEASIRRAKLRIKVGRRHERHV